MNANPTINLSTGIDKNGKPWYSVEVTVYDFTTERQFIDKIHYNYLKPFANIAPDKNKVDVSVNNNK